MNRKQQEILTRSIEIMVYGISGFLTTFIVSSLLLIIGFNSIGFFYLLFYLILAPAFFEAFILVLGAISGKYAEYLSLVNKWNSFLKSQAIDKYHWITFYIKRIFT